MLKARQVRAAAFKPASNLSMKPTPKAFASRLAPFRNELSVFATTPFRGLSLSC
jgi:hypothetical protein